jgi:hypothetical protein
MADRFCLSSDGKEEAFVLVVIVLEAVSENISLAMRNEVELNKPMFSAPQQSHINIVFLFPVDVSNRFPQSVQNTRDPMADIFNRGCCAVAFALSKYFLYIEPCLVR